MRNLKIKREIQLKRLEGISIEELGFLYQIPRGTVYSWVKDVPLSEKARRKLKNNSIVGRQKGRDSVLEKRRMLLDKIHKRAEQTISLLNIQKELAQVFCALLFWAEGAKATTSLNFVNSDPLMIRAFLDFLRMGFNINESKFRVLVHLHSYHNDQETKEYWSNITRIPLSQFNNSYKKRNTGKTKKKGYRGCISIRYYDAEIAKELTWLYTTLGNNRGVS